MGEWGGGRVTSQHIDADTPLKHENHGIAAGTGVGQGPVSPQHHHAAPVFVSLDFLVFLTYPLLFAQPRPE